MQRKLIEIENFSAGYKGLKVIESVNMSIMSDDYIGVIGPNGGGKTTLVKAILGLVKPMSGKINYLSNNHSAIGYLPQVNSLDKQFPISVLNTVMTGVQGEKRWWQGYNGDDKKRAMELVRLTGTEHLICKSIGDLSGGELQRVLLSRALMCSPELLLLDEPTTYVDNKFEKEFYEILNQLNKTIAIVMVSHDLGTICSYVKSIACVNHTLHYHPSNVITEEQLKLYDCPIQLIDHGNIPHTILHKH